MEKKTITINDKVYTLRKWNYIEGVEVVDTVDKIKNTTLALKYGLDDPKLTEEEIKKMDYKDTMMLYLSIIDYNMVEKSFLLQLQKSSEAEQPEFPNTGK